MSAFLLAPHQDDETLFAAYTCLRERPFVLACITEIENGRRGEEFFEAISTLNCYGAGLVYGADLERIESHLSSLYPDPGRVFAPAVVEGGHAEHNAIGEIARRLYGDQVTYYATYAPRGQRSRTDNEVPAEPWMIAKKLRALGCFVSQIEQESTRPWFTSLLDLREWYS